MYRRQQQHLPEYTILIRWTIQDVINWLVEIKLTDCIKCFRDGGVDGNKLVNITETDLCNIRCPRKYVGELISHVSNVSRPFGLPRVGGGGLGIRGNQKHEPPNQQNHMQDAGSGSDDCLTDEFDSDFSDDSPEEVPAAPPRITRREEAPLSTRSPAPSWPNKQPKRHLPVPPEPEEEQVYEDPDAEVADIPPVRVRAPVQDIRSRAPVPSSYDGPNEDYEEPDAAIKVQNFHEGPLPPLPGRTKAALIGQRVLPPSPDSEEEYEDPDRTVPSQAPHIPIGQRKPPSLPVSSIPISHREPPAEPEENYEDPGLSMPTKIQVPARTGQRKPPPPPTSSVPSTVRKRSIPQEPEVNYEDPDQTVSTVTGGQGGRPAPPPLSAIPRKTNAALSELPAYERPAEEDAPPAVPRSVPKSKRTQHKSKPVQVEEMYEIPDETDSPHPGYQQTMPLQREEETYEVPDAEVQDQDDYLEMEPDNVGLQPMRLLVSSSLNSDKTTRQRHLGDAMPLPNEATSQAVRTMYDKKAPLQSQDTYEIPDQEEVKVPQKDKKVIGGVALPGLRDLNISNAVPDSVPPQPTRPGRGLPRPPTVTPEKVQAKPVSSVTQNSVPFAAQNKPAGVTEVDLLRQKWYHGNITRLDANVKLKQLRLDGMYLIRKSSQGNDQPYTLQIFFGGKVYNLPIRRRLDNLLAVGKEEKVEEKAFTSLLDLVNTFKQNILVLTGGVETKLVKSMPKS